MVKKKKILFFAVTKMGKLIWCFNEFRVGVSAEFEQIFHFWLNEPE
jgi:hypothetical protein